MDSAFINIGVVFGVVQVANYFKVDTPENTPYIRIAYAFSQLLIAAVFVYIYLRIKAKADKTQLVYTDNKSAFSFMAPASDAEIVKTTVQEFDQEQLQTSITQTLTAAAILIFVHVQWGYLRPLFLQSIMSLRTIWTSQLFQIHVLGQPATGKLARPWKPAPSGGSASLTKKEIKAKERKEQKKKVNRID
ncbi:inorganic phosphate transporter Pho88 [Entophlyctis helioformis]|nr:inorganic phosphate transporter Pho88 [Entophlyctis helioformis]